jgi:cytochrome d ubiquinol oxidase subunit II
MFRLATPLGAIVLAFIGAVSLWTPLLSAKIAARWFSWPNIALLSPVPLLVAVLALAFYRSVAARREGWPFVIAILLFLVSYVGLGISLFPYVVPRAVTIWAAAAPDASLAFLLVGTAVLVPIILAYSAYSYWVFRGKVEPGGGYH